MVLEDLPTTIDNIGVEEFAELLKENGIMDELSNMTIFIPSNEAVEDFRHDLQHLNSVDNERNTYNIDDGLSYRLFFVRQTYFVTNRTQNMMTDFVRFLEDLHKLFRNLKLAKLLLFNFRTVFVNLTKSVVVFWVKCRKPVGIFWDNWRQKIC